MIPPDTCLIGVDLGGTRMRAGRVSASGLEARVETRVPAQADADTVLTHLYALIDRVWTPAVTAIGVGVPSVVDLARGIVYDVQNIPSWQEVPLRDLLQNRYAMPVYLNNDANCFALGEHYFGQARDWPTFIGLVIGTGFAGGVMIDGRLFTGMHCGAGEFGTMPYRDGIFEHYCSGQLFLRQHQTPGEVLYHRALQGDAAARAAFEELGYHLGQALLSILYAYDIPRFVLGGSVSQAYPLFAETLWTVLHTFAYRQTREAIALRLSHQTDAGLLGAAALALVAAAND